MHIFAILPPQIYYHARILRTIMFGLMSLKASMTTLPFTDWMGSTTTATALKSDSVSMLSTQVQVKKLI